MLKLPIRTLRAGCALALAALAAAPGPAAVLGPEAAACRAGAKKPALLVTVTGFKARAGTVRVQLYGSDPADFLASGRGLKRLDLPVTGAGAMPMCIALPRAGTYAVGVRHDLDDDGRSGWSDGGGFSNNPRISFARLRPSHGEVAVRVEKGVKAIGITLFYRQGLEIGPAGG